MKRKISVFFAVLLLIASGVTIATVRAAGENIRVSTTYTSHGVIRIDGNSEFNPLHGVTGGSGTLNDPWIISGWEIDAMAHGDGIYIGNTSDYFVIENCYIYNTSSTSSTYDVGAGIHFLNVKNGEVRYTIISDTNGDGISLSHSSFNVLEYNMLENIKYGGISLAYSGNNTVNGNIVEHANTGMFVGDSSNNTFKDNIISNINYNGATIYASSRDNEMINNTIFGNQNGIYLYWGANNNTIKENFLANNSEYGIKLTDGIHGIKDNHLLKNLFYYNHNSGDYYDSSTLQAWDESSGNNWWYSTTGNYWREWANNNGSNDNNGDGIVDWVYQIDGPEGKTDKYPLKYSIPTPPQNLTAQAGSGYVNLSWRTPIGDGGKAIISYRIYRNGTLIAKVPSTQLYYNDTSVDAHAYRYYVVAVNDEGEGLKSNFVKATPEAAIPEFASIAGILIVSFALIAILSRERKS